MIKFIEISNYLMLYIISILSLLITIYYIEYISIIINK